MAGTTTLHLQCGSMARCVPELMLHGQGHMRFGSPHCRVFLSVITASPHARLAVVGTRRPPRARPAPQVPAASLALFNTLSIILLIPVYDRGLVPLLRHFGTKLTLLSRIGAGPAPRRGMWHCWLSD
jgi:hypothetical protein